jgi:hypothetical protein
MTPNRPPKWQRNGSAVAFALLFLAAGCLSACARYAFTAPYKTGASLEDVTRATDACAREIIAGRWGGDPKACLSNRGWRIREVIWEKPGKTPRDLENDQKECLAAPARTDLEGLTPATLLAYTLRRCVEERGWTMRYVSD